jgi:CubicO group peptidase (beta-lactamase class C family)
MRAVALLVSFTLLMAGVPAASSSAEARVGRQAPVPDELEAAVKSAGALPRLRSLIVNHRGTIVLERYFNGARAAQPANIKSASKSVISALIGIAIAKGQIAGVDVPAARYLPELASDPDSVKRGISIEDLLTMRSGLQSTSGRGYGAWVQSKNWVRHVLSRPMIDRPGRRVEYSTGSSHLLSAILTKATGKSTWQFAQEELAKPLGFSLAKWMTDPQGIYFGGNEMLMTPRQMVRFGELYLNDGKVGDRQLLAKSWIDATRVPRGRSRWGSDREYGYGFWIRQFAGEDGYYAWGYGGQFIFIIPGRDLVIVTTSRVDVSRERRDHLDAIYTLVEELIHRLDTD